MGSLGKEIVSGGQGVSHYGGQGEPPLRGGCARVPRSKCPQPPVKGTWSEPQVDDQGGSVLPAIMAHFLSAIDMGSFGRVPPPQRYYGTLRLPAAHLAALRCLRLAMPSREGAPGGLDQASGFPFPL